MLREGNRSSILSLLLGGTVDLAIMGQPPDGAAVLAERFAAHPSVVVAHPRHPLCKKAKVSAHALRQEWFIIREEGSGTRTLSDQFFSAARFTPKVAMETSSNEMIKQGVMAGMGIAIVSLHTMHLERSLGLLRILPVDGFPVMRSWFVAQRRASLLLPAHAALRAFLIAAGSHMIDEISGGVTAAQ